MPSSLLITRRLRDKIRPVYAQLNQENLEVAGLLIQTYGDYVGKTKGELNEAVNGLEDLGYDYRYVRGLSTLLDHRCKLESEAALSPVKIRRQVFKTAHKEGFPTTSEARRAVLLQAARELEVTVEELEESLYGDLEDELILKDFIPVDAEALVEQYNLSLTQTLLFYSTELTFTTVGNWQRIFRQIKWLGLIYTVRKNDGGYEVKVDGPASLFKLNRRYGTSLAKLLPTIVQNQEWRVRAKILRRKEERRLLNLELNNEKHGGIMKALEKHDDGEVYDSQVELDFADRFKALDTGWTLIREPEPIPVGMRVMIPDFGFQKVGLMVYLEVVGFWTPRYLEEKVKKLRLLGNVDMIVAANKDLACHKLHKIGQKLNVIYYHRRIPLKPILDHLKAREEHMVHEQTRRLRVESLLLKKPVVEVREIAEQLGVLQEAVKEALKEKDVPGYQRLGDILIKKAKLKEIKDRLENQLNRNELSIGEASRIIEAAGGKRPTSILDALGYRIEWHGIDPESAKIRRKSTIQQHAFASGKEILIDDAGWGDLILGVVVGALRLPDHKYMERRIPVSSFQPPNFENKQYLNDAVKIAEEVVEVMKPDEETCFKICSGYVLSSIRKQLRDRGFKVEEVEITGELQEKVETGYLRWCKEVGVPTEKLKDKRRFWTLLRWIKEKPNIRERLVKTGWKSWKQKWRKKAFQKEISKDQTSA